MPYPFFMMGEHGSNAVVLPPQWETIRRGLLKNLLRSRTYYQNVNAPVKNQHPFVSLIKSVQIPLEMNDERYYQHVESLAIRHCSRHHMTTYLSEGKPFKGVFFDDQCTEFFLAGDSFISPDRIRQNWKTFPSVRLLTHPKTDINMVPGNARHYSREVGLVVLYVHLPALMLQYKCFVENEQLYNNGLQSDPRYFIARVVAPNIMASQLDLAIINRVFAIDNGTYIPPEVSNHPFTLSIYDYYVDTALEGVVNRARSRPARFTGALMNIPTIVKENALEAVLMPSVMETRASNWLLVVARIKLFKQLCTLLGADVAKTNRADMSAAFMNMASYGTMDQVQKLLPPEYFQDFHFDLDLCLRFAGRQSVKH